MSRTRKKLETVIENIEGLMNDELEILSRVARGVTECCPAGVRDELLADIKLLQNTRIHRQVGRKPYTLRMLRKIFEDMTLVSPIDMDSLERELTGGFGASDDGPDDDALDADDRLAAKAGDDQEDSDFEYDGLDDLDVIDPDDDLLDGRETKPSAPQDGRPLPEGTP